MFGFDSNLKNQGYYLIIIWDYH